jgi:hypothetical protein
LKIGGERQRAAGARDGHDAIFQRLPQCFERSFVELGQLIE